MYPGDQIVVAGSDEQIDKFKQMIDGSIVKEKPETRVHVTLEHFTLEEGNPLIGRSIIESHIRDEAHCIVMGIKRGEDYLMNPEPQEVLEQDDIVIVAGETERLKQFVDSFNN